MRRPHRPPRKHLGVCSCPGQPEATLPNLSSGPRLCGVSLPWWRSRPGALASAGSPELTLSLAALPRWSVRRASWLCDTSACSRTEATRGLSAERFPSARVRACVRAFQMGSSVWEDEKHDTCFRRSADCSVTEASFAPGCSAISLLSRSCPIPSRDKRFPLLLPEIQAPTLQAAAPDCLEAIHLPEPPWPPAHASLPVQPALTTQWRGLWLAALCP